MSTFNPSDQQQDPPQSEPGLSPEAQQFCVDYGVDTTQLKDGVLVMQKVWAEHMHPPDILKMFGLPDTAPIVISLIKDE